MYSKVNVVEDSKMKTMSTFKLIYVVFIKFSVEVGIGVDLGKTFVEF